MPADPTPSRRDFLRTTAAGAAAMSLPATAAADAPRPPGFGKARSCILINLVGGPSHLDTFDPKPDAPAEVRGPFRPIHTRVPGLHLSELFPKLAGVADRFALLRGMHHDAPPVHEAGLQLVNTGRYFGDGPEWPSVGAVDAYLRGRRPEPFTWWAVLPHDGITTGIAVGCGQATGWLSGRVGEPTRLDKTRNDPPSLWVSLMVASAMAGFSHAVVTVNTHATVFDAPSWDCHAAGGSLATTLDDYRDTVAPEFDTAFADLVGALERDGKLDSTLVVATGEFGRTPYLNGNGGRDHWANCWTAIVAGGGVRGGRVIGASDRLGGEPKDRPTTPQELVATIFHALGVPPDTTIPGPDGSPVAVYPARPVAELF